MWKRFVKDYLSFTYKERTGIFIVLGLVMICIIIPFLYPYIITKKQYDHSKFNAEIAQLQLTQLDTFAGKKYLAKKYDEDNFADDASPSEKNYYPKSPVEVFYFDPNNATPAEWKRLGIKDKTIVTIQKYLLKGGHFYKPEDIGKIWGLYPEQVKRLLPYVNIAPKTNAYVKNQPANSFEKRPAYIPEVYKPLDINDADTTAFIALPGIGSKLAQRIINFRNKLGGFYSVSQIGETFGLPDSTFQKIKPRLVLSDVAIKKLNINTASLDDLKTHPYIRYTIANPIVQYRNQHGNFTTIADVKKVMVITDEVYKKIEPYLTVTQ